MCAPFALCAAARRQERHGGSQRRPPRIPSSRTSSISHARPALPRTPRRRRFRDGHRAQLRAGRSLTLHTGSATTERTRAFRERVPNGALDKPLDMASVWRPARVAFRNNSSDARGVLNMLSVSSARAGKPVLGRTSATAPGRRRTLRIRCPFALPDRQTAPSSNLRASLALRRGCEGLTGVLHPGAHSPRALATRGRWESQDASDSQYVLKHFSAGIEDMCPSRNGGQWRQVHARNRPDIYRSL